MVVLAGVRLVARILLLTPDISTVVFNISLDLCKFKFNLIHITLD